MGIPACCVSAGTFAGLQAARLLGGKIPFIPFIKKYTLLRRSSLLVLGGGGTLCGLAAAPSITTSAAVGIANRAAVALLVEQCGFKW